MSRTLAPAGAAILLLLAWEASAAPDEPVDLAAIQKLRAAERSHSQLMDTLFNLTDVRGPRLTNSPNFFEAADWIVRQLAAQGIDARKESWGPFGRSWRYTRYSAAMVEPQYTPLIGFPLAWSGSTVGSVTTDVVLTTIYTDADFNAYRGKLKGKIVLNTPEREISLQTKPLATRYSAESLAELDTFSETQPDRAAAARSRLPEPWRTLSRQQLADLRKRINNFFASEQVIGIISPSTGGEDGTVFAASAGSREPEDPVAPPSVAIALEQYNRMCRLLQHKIPVRVSLDVRAEFLPPQDSINVIAELPGGSKKAEVVMLGAHLDSWQGGTGATDNAAGCAVMLEALRLLKTLGLKMDRTVRLALWGGEEQGLLGSKAYVKEHFGDPETMQLKPEHARLDAYFNLDNGSGRVRGIYLQGNDMCRPIFEAWLKPFRDMDAGAITSRDTGSTDHVSFDAVGLPGFQFVQDELEYSTVTHHSNMDLYDHVSEADLKQAATIVAAFVYLAANRPDMLPRKPLPAPHSAPSVAPGEQNKGKPALTHSDRP